MKQLIKNYVIALAFAFSTLTTQASNRIISTDGFVTELIFALGAENQLIAIDVTSQLPATFSDLPNIGYHRNLSAEGLLSLKPSIIIGSEYMGPESTVNALGAANISVLQLPSAKTPRQLKQNITKIADTLSKQAQGTSLKTRLDAQLSKLSEHDLSNERIAFLLSMDTSKLRLAGKGSNGDALIKLMGAKNVGEFENYQNVSAESLLAMQPTIILVAGKQSQTAVDDLLKSQHILQHSEAGKSNKILSVNGATLIAGLSISAVDEALRLAKQLR